MILSATMAGCDACPIAFKRLWCHFSCSPNQSDFVEIRRLVPGKNPDNQIQSVYVNITKSFADRFWLSCQNAGFKGTESFKNLFFNRVSSLFGLMAERSPTTEPPTTHLVHSFNTDHSPTSKALNVTLENENYTCSREETEPLYVLPTPTLLSIPLKIVNLGVYFIFTGFMLGLGFRNIRLRGLKPRLVEKNYTKNRGHVSSLSRLFSPDWAKQKRKKRNQGK